jgi:hypothetical protein
MSHTYEQLLRSGRDGDKSVIIKMTARQVAIVELIVDAAVDFGVGTECLAAVADVLGMEGAERALLEFNIAQKRIGIAMCRVMGDHDYAAQLTADLARLDGEVAGL